MTPSFSLKLVGCYYVIEENVSGFIVPIYTGKGNSAFYQ